MRLYILTVYGVIPLDVHSDVTYLFEDKDFELLVKSREARARVLEAIGVDRTVIGRIGEKLKDSDSYYIKRTDEFNVEILKEGDIE